MLEPVDHLGPAFISAHEYDEKTSTIDNIANIQKQVNELMSDYVKIIEIPSGSKLMRWSKSVLNTWWYRFFSRFDRRIKKF